MGLITNATIIFSSTTFLGYLGLRHLRNVIKEVPLPTSSILQQYFQQAKQSNPDASHFADAFQAELPSNAVEYFRKNKNKSLGVDTCVRNFYSSWIFKAEKTIMKIILKQPEPDLSSFEVGKSIYVWKVEERNEEEVLLVWEQGPVKGSTWFCLSLNENVVKFGSSIQTPKSISNVASKKDSDTTKESENNLYSSSMNGSNNPSLNEKIIKSVKNIGWSIVLSFHRTYSMVILNGVLIKITKQVK